MPIRIGLIVLWLAWAILLGAGLLAPIVDDQRFGSLESELKASSSLALVLFAWLSVRKWPPTMRPAAVLIAIGMTLGCLGDASPLLGSRWPDPQRTLVNMVLFGIGHLAYIRACLIVGRHASRGCRPFVWYGSFVVWSVIGAIAWYFAAYLGTQNAGTRIPALGYTFLLSATTGVMVGYAFANRLFIPMAVGTMLFLLSDVLLAVWIFHDTVYEPFDLVWLSYGVGQMLIVTGGSFLPLGTTVSSSPGASSGVG